MKPCSARKFGREPPSGSISPWDFMTGRSAPPTRGKSISIGWIRSLAVFQPVCARRIAECGRRGGLQQTLDRPHRGMDWPTSPSRRQDCGQAYLGILYAAALDVVAGQRAGRDQGGDVADVHGAWLRRLGGWPRLPGLALYICRGRIGSADVSLCLRHNLWIAIATRSTGSWFSSPRSWSLAPRDSCRIARI